MTDDTETMPISRRSSPSDIRMLQQIQQQRQIHKNLKSHEPLEKCYISEIPSVVQQEEDTTPNPEDICDLFVKGFPFGAAEREVAHIFRQYGGFEGLRFVRPVGKTYELCFVTFSSREDAENAREAVDGYVFDQDYPNSRLEVSMARTLRTVPQRQRKTTSGEEETGGRSDDQHANGSIRSPGNGRYRQGSQGSQKMMGLDPNQGLFPNPTLPQQVDRPDRPRQGRQGPPAIPGGGPGMPGVLPMGLSNVFPMGAGQPGNASGLAGLPPQSSNLPGRPPLFNYPYSSVPPLMGGATIPPAMPMRMKGRYSVRSGVPQASDGHMMNTHQGGM